ncbi:MAG: hypothetical protein ACJ8CR_30215 [Roseiflexaceae bacterium]
MPPTPTPTPGNVVVTKQVNPNSGISGTGVVYTITIQNNTGAAITLDQIRDNMDPMGGFAGVSCTGPGGSGTCVNQSGSQSGDWLWIGSFSLANGAGTTMTISGSFVTFPPGPGTPTPTPQTFCNPGVTVFYNGSSSATLGSGACFILN